MTKRIEALKDGTRVIDRDGFRGTIVKTTEWEGSRWYDVRIWDGNRNVGVAVRYDSDLTPDAA